MPTNGTDAEFSYLARRSPAPPAPLPVFTGSGSELEEITRDAAQAIYQITGLSSLAYTLQQHLIAYAVAIAESRPEAEQRYLRPLIDQMALSNNAAVVDVVEGAAQRIQALGDPRSAIVPMQHDGGFLQQLWGQDQPSPGGGKSRLRRLWEDW